MRLPDNIVLPTTRNAASPVLATTNNTDSFPVSVGSDGKDSKQEQQQPPAVTSLWVCSTCYYSLVVSVRPHKFTTRVESRVETGVQTRVQTRVCDPEMLRGSRLAGVA